MPDDFNVNILLPGAVWLLISVLIGRVSVSRMETDAITVVLFVVISLVVFIVPMAVYMEYRKKIECIFRHTVRQRFVGQDTIDCRTGSRMPVFLSTGFSGCPERQQDDVIYGSTETGRIP